VAQLDQHGRAFRLSKGSDDHSTIAIFGSIDVPSTEMRVQVTIGVQKPEKIDTTALAATLPRGNATVTAVFGGQDVTNPESGEVHVIATAAIEAFLPSQTGKWRLDA